MTQSFRIDLLVEPFFSFNIFRIFCHRRALIQLECRTQVTEEYLEVLPWRRGAVWPLKLSPINNRIRMQASRQAHPSADGSTALGNRCALCCSHPWHKYSPPLHAAHRPTHITTLCLTLPCDQNLRKRYLPESRTHLFFSLYCPHAQNSTWHTGGSQEVSMGIGQT